MAGQLKRLAGPAYIAAAAADILTTPGAGTYHVIKHIQIVNKDSTNRTFSLYLGLTGGSAGGTEIMGGTRTVTANSTINEYFQPGLKMVNTEYLSGVASSASTLVITVMGDSYVA